MAPTNTTRKVAVVIPCHNEAAAIAEVIQSLPRSAAARYGITLDIYVIDNRSTDATAQVAAAAGALVIQEPKKGKGNALRRGFASVASDADFVVMLDGDNTYSADEILRLIEPLMSDFCDVVIGSRLGGRIQAGAMNRLHRAGNRLFTLATRLLYGAHVSDVLTGYFAWKKAALDALRPHVLSQGFAIEMEMITKMARLGQRMTSVPISYHPRAGQSHLRPFRDGLKILFMLLKNIWWRPRPSKTAGTSRRMVFVSDGLYPYLKGGKEKRLHEITKRLAAMGHDVHIYTMHWWGAPDKVRQEYGVTLHALCPYYPMYQGNRRTIKEGIMFGLACFKLFWVRFDVLDVDHMPFFPVFSAWLVCLLRRKRLYATWHESLSHCEWVSYMGAGGFIAAIIERLSTHLPHRITAASAHTKELLAAHHGRRKRVDLVASGIDATMMKTVPSAALDCDVLFAGRLVKDKNVDKLIQAVAILAETKPEVHCLIIGDGPERTRLQRLVQQRRLAHNVVFLDPLPEAADVYSYMKAARVFCSPSVREGFGITTLEALACGTPVVTVNSQANAARHLVHDGQNGSVVVLEPEALAAAIHHWLSVAQKLDVNTSVAEYDWQQLAQKQAEVYLQ